MRSLILGVGAAALALSAPLAALGPGGGQGGGGKGGQGGPPGGGGGGNGKGGGGGPQAQRGGGGGGGPQAQRGGPQRIERGPERRAQRGPEARPQHGPEQRQARSKRQRAPEQRQARAERQRGPDRREAQARGRDVERQARRGPEQRGGGQQRIERQAERGSGFNERGAPVAVTTYGGPATGPAAYYGNPVRIDGCPPGLAAKNNGCLPPGQARKWVGQRVPAVLATSLLPVAYRSWYPDNDDYYYREQDGLIYRVARSTDLVDGYAPLFGYGPDYYPDYYYAGEQYPSDYVSFYNVPLPYQRYYADGGDDLYRYGDGGIYQVDRSSGLVDSLVALLAGDLSMGQPLPDGYDVYNVPYQYRDRYADTGDDWYRYNDGYIYQVDPQTRLVTAVIEALV